MAFFGGQANTRQQSKNLVEFRAGKMYMKGKMVHPDKRKGQVYVYQSDDSLMHFCWKDSTKGTVDDVRSSYIIAHIRASHCRQFAILRHHVIMNWLILII